MTPSTTCHGLIPMQPDDAVIHPFEAREGPNQIVLPYANLDAQAPSPVPHSD
jgi:hypothetical protein